MMATVDDDVCTHKQKHMPLDPDAPELSEIKIIAISIGFPKRTKWIMFWRLEMISR